MATASKADKTSMVEPEPTRDPTPVTPPVATWPPTCKTCKFYDAAPSYCRVDSPQLTSGAPSTSSVTPGITVFPPQVSFWPVVKDTDWCGQYIAAG